MTIIATNKMADAAYTKMRSGGILRRAGACFVVCTGRFLLTNGGGGALPRVGNSIADFRAFYKRRGAS